MPIIKDLFDSMQAAERVWKGNKPPPGTKGLAYQSDIPWPTPQSPRRNLHHDVCETFTTQISRLDSLDFYILATMIQSDFWRDASDDKETFSVVPLFCLYHSIKRRVGLEDAQRSSKFLYDLMGINQFCDKLCWVWHDRMPFEQKRDAIASLMKAASHCLQRSIVERRQVRIHWPIYDGLHKLYVPDRCSETDYKHAAEVWAKNRKDQKIDLNLEEVRNAIASGRTLDGDYISPVAQAYYDAYNGKKEALEAQSKQNATKAANSPWGVKPRAPDLSSFNFRTRRR